MQQAVLDAKVVELGEAPSRADVFRRLADRHLDASYRLARAILGDWADAEDATHDAFVTAWQKWATLRDPARFEHWFQRILVNTCRNHLRRRSRLRIVDLSADLSDPTDDVKAAADERERLGAAIACLAPDHGVVLALRYYRDLTVDEIAGVLGVPSGTVKSRLHHALRRLHAHLDAADAREAL